jgi:hypothetical protein
MNFLQPALSTLLLSISLAASAQSCTTVPVSSPTGGLSGTTCSATNQLPVLANGAIQTPGPQAIYAVQDFSAALLDETFTLSADPASNLSLFVCRNPCSTYASCVGVADVDGTGHATVHLARPLESIVVVGSMVGTCATYTLSISGTSHD